MLFLMCRISHNLLFYFAVNSIVQAVVNGQKGGNGYSEHDYCVKIQAFLCQDNIERVFEEVSDQAISPPIDLI